VAGSVSTTLGGVPRAGDALDGRERRDPHLDRAPGRPLGERVQEIADGRAAGLPQRRGARVRGGQHGRDSGQAQRPGRGRPGPRRLPQGRALLIDGGEEPGGIRRSGGHASGG
jgi:hypothetical protein